MAYNQASWILAQQAAMRPMDTSLYGLPIVCPQQMCAPPMALIGGEFVAANNINGNRILKDASMVLLPTPQGLIRERFPGLLQPPAKEQVKTLIVILLYQS